MLTMNNNDINISHDEAIKILTRRLRDCYGADRKAYNLAIALINKEKLKTSDNKTRNWG